LRLRLRNYCRSALKEAWDNEGMKQLRNEGIKE